MFCAADGSIVCDLIGFKDGTFAGKFDGSYDGFAVMRIVGCCDGMYDGFVEMKIVGCCDGDKECKYVGECVGGFNWGFVIGDKEGFSVISLVGVSVYITDCDGNT